MVCIYCGHKTKVNNSRSSVKNYTTWRRRQCLQCMAIYTTREYPELDSALRVRTRQNRLEPFTRDDLFLSVYFSLSHTKTALNDANELTDTIISHILDYKTPVIKYSHIIELTLGVLNKYDSVAYTYYLAHHQL